MSKYYLIKRNLIFSTNDTLGPSVLLTVDRVGELAVVQAHSRKGVPLGKVEVYYKTINIWRQFNYISEAPMSPSVIQGDMFGYTTIFDDINPELNLETDNFHGCYAAVVLFPDSLYVSPVYEDKQVLLRRIFQEIQTQEDYWIIQGPEPLLKRLDSSVTAQTAIGKPNVEILLKNLKKSGVTIVYRNPKGELDSTDFGKRFVSKF